MCVFVCAEKIWFRRKYNFCLFAHRVEQKQQLKHFSLKIYIDALSFALIIIIIIMIFMA